MLDLHACQSNSCTFLKYLLMSFVEQTYDESQETYNENIILSTKVGEWKYIDEQTSRFVPRNARRPDASEFTENPNLKMYTCLSDMFQNGKLDNWVLRKANLTSKKSAIEMIRYDSVKTECEKGDPCPDQSCRLNNNDIKISSGKGPPISGPCGASYRPSENFAISSGHQPFLVEVLVEPKSQVRQNSPRCLGSIITSRHILTAGKLPSNHHRKLLIEIIEKIGLSSKLLL